MNHRNLSFGCGQWAVFGVILGLISSAHAQAAEADAQKASLRSPIVIAPEGDVPRLMLSGTNWDFGQKWVGEAVATTEILLKNEGKAELTIDDVVTSCGCAAVAPKSGGTWKGKVLAPGASEAMTIAFNTARQVKDVVRTITVMSSDPVQPRAVIHIKGNVLNAFAGKPEDRINFARLQPDAKETKEIELVNVTGQPMQLKLQPQAADSPFDMKLTEVEPGKAYKLAATTRPPLRAGANAVEVQIETGNPKAPLLNIPVSLFVPAPVFITPAKLYTDSAKSVQRLVRLSYQTNQPVKIKEVRSTHPDLIKAELVTLRSMGSATPEFGDHTIRVTLPPGTQLPATGASLEIHTDAALPEYRKFVLPLETLRAPTAAQSPGAPVSVTAQTTR